MTAPAETDRPAARGGGWGYLQPALLLTLGLVLAGTAQIVVGEMTAFMLVAAAGGCLGAAMLLTGLSLLRARRRVARIRAVADLMRTDPVPGFLTDAAGVVLTANPAAHRRFSQPEAVPLSTALSGVLPNANALTHRLSEGLAMSDAASERIATARGEILLTARRLDHGHALWRLEQRSGETPGGDGIGLPMLVASATGEIVSLNGPMRALLGRGAERLEDIFADGTPPSGRLTRVTAASGQRDILTVVHRTPSGRLEIYVLPPEAMPQAVTVAARAFEALPVALLHVGPEGRIRASNRQAQRLLDIPPEMDGYLSELVEGLGRPLRDWVADTVAQRLPSRSEVVRARSAREERFLQISLNRISDESGPSLLAVLNDATELKTMEQKFVQSQKMQAVGELAGGVAHDFNNLLTAITGHCDLLLLRHDQGDEDYGDLVQINQNANRAASLVGQLLAFSRQQKLRLESIDLRESIGDLLHLLNRLVGEKITLRLTHDPHLLPVRADRQQLDQVIMNLVVNSRDAMPSGGEIRVETRLVQLDVALARDNAVVPAGSYVTISVIDEGHGIPPDRLGRIFEPFFTTKEVGKGTGLGLSMAYGVVKQSGGYIFVDSKVGEGTRFVIYIPVYDTPHEAALTDAATSPGPPARGNGAQRPAAPRVRLSRPGDIQSAPHVPSTAPEMATRPAARILIVEDEAPVRAFASRALQLRGYEVVEAADAEQALRALAQAETPFDLFVTDVIMPGKDGPTWVREALCDHPDTRVVFVSGYSAEDIGEAAKDIPGAAFLPKPFSLAELSETVADQLR